LVIGLLASAIAVERIFFLNRVHANADRMMGRVNQLAGRGDWAGCDAVLQNQKGKPVYNVLRAGLSAVDEKRETLESVLQEAILKELPRLERFLPALNIMGAVAPLLGLLGTVTGMIGTFQSITLHGAGDPRMMSGGISEALITTMLGLSVAIPIMLVHSFLRRRLEHIIGDMEEKAVALSNIICRECTLAPVADQATAMPKSTPLQVEA
jgi:biopolymer transport protein ExbB